ncbi:transcription factor bHLH68-like [Cucurbita maxima]|uniref:Transcription factor bHLH68-like n=1 Tax=Cucurbita maxima TaxID=3661 RepID=A0A6J1KMG6_CUCMA|nr:transcription factor bHLH68-like [Cucurbita maxima]
MMAGNPNWWGMFSPSFSSFAEQPQSWSQLLLGEEERVLNQTQMGHYQPKKLENWEHQILDHTTTTTNPSPPPPPNFVDIVKQEFSNTNKFLNFSSNNTNFPDLIHNQPTAAADHLPEVRFSCKSFEQSNHIAPISGSACKKARVHPPSSSQPPLKVRKEKLVDRITALHQIVSPFGKTDTASVLSEAIGYIRFLQGQIEALSYPYLRSAPKHVRDSGSGGEEMRREEKAVKELRSRGLCLVPVSCTQLVGGDNNGAAYWAPAYGNGF